MSLSCMILIYVVGIFLTPLVIAVLAPNNSKSDDVVISSLFWPATIVVFVIVVFVYFALVRIIEIIYAYGQKLNAKINNKE